MEEAMASDKASNNPPKIYKVWTYDETEGNVVIRLGYAEGQPEDIKNFFGLDFSTGHEIHCDEIIARRIKPADVAQKKSLLCQKLELENKLSKIKQQLDEKLPRK